MPINKIEAFWSLEFAFLMGYIGWLDWFWWGFFWRVFFRDINRINLFSKTKHAKAPSAEKNSKQRCPNTSVYWSFPIWNPYLNSVIQGSDSLKLCDMWVLSHTQCHSKCKVTANSLNLTPFHLTACFTNNKEKYLSTIIKNTNCTFASQTPRRSKTLTLLTNRSLMLFKHLKCKIICTISYSNPETTSNQ